MASFDDQGNLSDFKSLGVVLPNSMLTSSTFVNRGIIISIGWQDPGTFLPTSPKWAKIDTNGSIGKWTVFTGLTLGVPDFLATGGSVKVGKRIFMINCNNSTDLGFDAYLDLNDDGTPKKWTTYKNLPFPNGNIVSIGTDGSRFIWATGNTPDGGNTFTTDFWVLRVN